MHSNIEIAKLMLTHELFLYKDKILVKMPKNQSHFGTMCRACYFGCLKCTNINCSNIYYKEVI